ncbi:MAG: zinc-dependent peptidase [Pseudomonadales bacterium]|nr:zinc-dependent peptidase [Pseudomonadales bacterium]MCP5358262.1 zinc-dependent peptidase [Pseudomonadales bacterium]
MDLKSILSLIVLWGFGIVVALMLFVYPRYRRKKVDASPFPAPWLQILRDSLPVYKRMWPDQQRELRQLIKRFLNSKEFVGCAGQTINDEIRVTIAAHACLLLVGRPSHEYQDLHTILVYPTGFVVNHEKHDEFGLVTEGEHFLIGESWGNGKVILAWDSVQQSVRNFADGQNVVLHEFAHQLDHESGVTNGAPLLYSKGAYADWSRVFSEEFLRLQHDSAHHHHTLIDEYGATNPAEFFAVVTETFYERPYELASRHPSLFEELMSYYRVDPREWQRVPGA